DQGNLKEEIDVLSKPNTHHAVNLIVTFAIYGPKHESKCISINSMSWKIFMENPPNKYRRGIPTDFDRNQHNQQDFCLKLIPKCAVGIDRQFPASFFLSAHKFYAKNGGYLRNI
ncbi:MAG: hypothetical protein O7F12_02025, partial [Nitrospirae bacterium]|nr:hypothetical protein [Nitrospirota bacterium]